MSKIETPQEKWNRSKVMITDARAVEKEAIREAIVEADGYLGRAAAIIGITPTALARIVTFEGGRHHDLKRLLHGKKGAPPSKPESIAKRMGQLPKALLEAKGAVQAPAKVKTKLKPLKLRETPMSKTDKGEGMTKKTEAEWNEIVDRWLAARKTGANQKEFAAEHGVGVSTLRERTAKRLAGSNVSMEAAAHAVTGGEL
jgi:hypothetical protein